VVGIRLFAVWVGSLSMGWLAPAWGQEPAAVKGIWKLSQTRGGRMPVLDNDDQLGRSVAVLGDLNGDGTLDLAAAGLGDDDGGIDQGAAHVLFLRGDGRVLGTRKISALEGGFTGDLDPGDQFGRALAGIGDLDGDGIPDLAVGANYDDDGGMNRGAVWLLCLDRDGSVRRTSKISSLAGGFAGPLRNNDEFGRSVASLGDLDGNGVPDLAVGAPTDATGGPRRGAVWILFLQADGSVLRSVKIASGMGGFTGRLRNYDWFGFSVANLGDFDGDGVTDLAVGAALDDDGAVNAGAAWLLTLLPDGRVKGHRKISLLSGGFTGLLESPDQFGTSVARVGDLNGDGVPELAVGAVKDGDGGRQRGAVYLLYLTSDGTVAFHRKISALEGGMPARQLDNFDWFGSSLAPLGDFDGDGVPDLAIGARNDDDGGANRGAVYLTYLERGPLGSAPLVAAGGPAGRAAAEPADRALDAPAFAGPGPEPDGSLTIRSGQALLPVPEGFPGPALVHLLGARRALAERTECPGVVVDANALTFHRSVVAPGGQEALEIPVPASPELRWVQALWIGAGGVRLTDAWELPGP